MKWSKWAVLALVVLAAILAGMHSEAVKPTVDMCSTMLVTLVTWQIGTIVIKVALLASAVQGHTLRL